jgi:predicted RNA-binding Zn ribbon-like protein
MDELNARFVADCAGLDFLNSGDPSKEGDADWLGTGEGFLIWLEHAQLVPLEVLRRMRFEFEAPTFDKVASRARNLREWLREFLKNRCRSPSLGFELSELQMLNEVLGDDEVYYRVVASTPHDSVPALQPVRRWTAPESLIYPVAEAVARLICVVDFGQIRHCERCGLTFVDRTRRQVRRWCSMTTCGNRAKQAAHRSRRKPSI